MGEMIQKELMLIRQVRQKNVIFVIVGIFKIKVLSLNLMSFCNCCHDLMQKAMDFSGVATVSVIGSD